MVVKHMWVPPLIRIVVFVSIMEKLQEELEPHMDGSGAVSF
jgi:hypothetical protein